MFGTGRFGGLRCWGEWFTHDNTVSYMRVWT